MYHLYSECFCFSDLGTSDDSSLSDSVVQDEGKMYSSLNSTVKEQFCIMCSVHMSKLKPGPVYHNMQQYNQS